MIADIRHEPNYLLSSCILLLELGWLRDVIASNLYLV